MKQCVRCKRWFKQGDSTTCDPCWVELGQMSFWQDEEEGQETEALMEWEDPRIALAEMDDGLDRHPIDTIFDRDRDIYGGAW
jgi:predicted  nucleic acid-binding Zn-ribbon protein